MNGKTAKALRRTAPSLKAYKAMKKAHNADRGQNPKPLRQRTHKVKAAIKATWPHTDNQKLQSRPLIVLHPARSIGGYGSRLRAFAGKMFNTLPKWECDAAALRGGL